MAHSENPVQLESGVDWRALWAAERKHQDGVEDVAFWDRRAQGFSASCQRSSYAHEYLERAGIRPGETVIDMGCGSGTLALPLAAEGHLVTACDLSSGMLDRLRQQAQEAGIAERIDARQLSWLADWDDLPVADVFVASRSLYSLDLHDTILKMERHARRRVCITVATLQAPGHDRTMLHALGRPCSEKAEFVYIVNLLMQMGRLPELSYISHVKPVFGADPAELRAEFEREDGPFSAEESEKLDAFIAENFVPVAGEDGVPTVQRRYDRHVRWAFIAWNVGEQA